MADSPAPNRNVVSRRVAVKPRVEARTTEIDCSQFAKLVELEEATPKKPVVDLDAEIEVVSSLPAGPETARGSARFAHTLPREAPELPAPPEALIPIPRITSEIPTLALQQLTRPPSDLPIEASEPELRGSRGWIIFASVSVALALVALIFVLEL